MPANAPGVSDRVEDESHRNAGDRSFYDSLRETLVEDNVNNREAPRAAGTVASSGLMVRSQGLLDEAFGTESEANDDNNIRDPVVENPEPVQTAGDERLSNFTIPPPNPQETSHRLDDVLLSLTKLLNDCKDKRQSIGQSPQLAVMAKCLPGPSQDFFAPPRAEHSRPLLDKAPAVDLRPVCEIKPFVSVEALARAQTGGGGRSAGNGGGAAGPVRGRRRSTSTRRGGRSSSTGTPTAPTRRQPRRGRSRPEESAAIDDTIASVVIAAGEPAATEAAVAALMGAEGRNAGGGEQERVLSLDEDGLEIINDLDLATMDEEAAAAAASLLDLDFF